MQPRPATVPTHLCPLCGKPNQCAMAAACPAAAPCWCTTATFTPQLLAQVPAAAQGQACICAACAASAACPAAR